LCGGASGTSVRRVNDTNRAARPGGPSAAEAASEAIARLRLIAKIEAVSFLILLGVAMPLKYLAGLPLAVKLVGWAHGVLFILFVLALVRAKRDARLPTPFAALVFVAALLPFGPFVIDQRLSRQVIA
jgi:integral membrane protein